MFSCLSRFFTLLQLVLLASACATSPTATVPDAADSGAADAGADAFDPLGTQVYHRRVELGTVHTAADGRTPPVAFSVPPQATSFLVTVRGAPDNEYTLSELSGPSGTIIVLPNWLDLSNQPWLCLPPFCVNRIAAEPAVAGFLVPNTPLTPLVAGQHTLRAYAFDHPAGANQRSPMSVPVEIAVELVAKPPAWKQKGRIDLNFCLTGYAGITAAYAPQHPRILSALADIQAIYAQANIELGTVRYFDIQTDTMIFTHDDGSDGELGDLFAKGAGLPLGVNVFLVDAVQVTAAVGGGSALVMGLSGGIPGPPLEVGTRRSGVVVSLRPSGGPDLLGRLIAHEVGHFLGLFHTIEQATATGTVITDNLPDTPDNDANNLMNWLESENSFTLTPQQAGVMQDNPWVVPAALP